MSGVTTYNSDTAIVDLVTLLHHELEHISRCHDILLRDVLPYGHDCEMVWSLFYLVVEEYTALSRAHFPQDVFLEAIFHSLD